MTPERFKQLRRDLGLSFPGVARVVGIRDARLARRWADGERNIPAYASGILEYLAAGGPEYLVCVDPDDAAGEYVVRMVSPRFVARVIHSSDGYEDLKVIAWLDEPDPDEAALAAMTREAGEALHRATRDD